jgi:hypothetical protein
MGVEGPLKEANLPLIARMVVGKDQAVLLGLRYPPFSERSQITVVYLEYAVCEGSITY